MSGTTDARRRGPAPEAVSPARAVALRVLLRLQRGDRLDDSVASLPEFEALDDRDRALANELVTGVVKRRVSLDAVLDSYTKVPLHEADPRTRETLRLAAYQLLFLDRVPAYAVVNDAVASVARGGRGTRGFVNAVLRRVAGEGRGRFTELAGGDGAKAWSVRHSCPPWVVELLRDELGDAAADRLLRAANAAPERCLRVNPLRGSVEAAAERLGPAFTTAEVEGLPEGLLYEGPSLERSAAFADGFVTPQSRGSQVAGAVAASCARADARVLDLCAAPGTKTAQLAGLLPHAKLAALDVDERRVDAMRRNLDRLRVRHVEVLHRDLLELPTSYDGAWDVVLLDAPCTGLGTLASRPDLRWRRRRDDVERLAALQRRLLLRAARCVSPGGALVYSVCTLPRAETLDVVAELLDRDWVADDLGALWPGLAHPADARHLLVVPPAYGTTGFFVARLRRSSGSAG